MSRPAAPRWPFHDLDRALIHAGYTKRWQKCSALNIPERTWFRWRRHGVPEMAADAAAMALDSHPVLIWGRAWETGIPPVVSAPPSEDDIAC